MFEIISLALSVAIGVLIVLLIKPKQEIIRYLLTFSGAYLLSITVLKFLPEIYKETNTTNIGLFVLMGLLFQLVLDFFSKGVDHGHVHHQDFTRFPWALFISLCIHSLMEGLAVSDHDHHNLLWAIVIHKIPITMVLVTFLWVSKMKRLKSIVFLIGFGLMSPLGVWLGTASPVLVQYQPFINAFIAGMFLHISTAIISEASDNHKFKWIQFAMVILGVLIAYL